MANDLMELVAVCETIPKPKKQIDVSTLFQKSEELKSLGMVSAATEILKRAEKESRPQRLAGFINVTTKDIEKFLDKKVEEYNKKHQKKEKKKSNMWTDEWVATTEWLTITQARERFPEPSLSYTTVRREDVERWYSSKRHRIDVYRGTREYDAQRSALENEYRRRMESFNFYRTDTIRTLQQDSMLEQMRIVQQEAMISGIGIGVMSNGVQSSNTLSKRTCDYMGGEGTIGQYIWTENKLGEYPGIPPKKVLDRIKQILDMKIFDYLSIASVKGIKDPLVLGRFNDDNDNRYFIDQWGDDVKIEELM